MAASSMQGEGSSLERMLVLLDDSPSVDSASLTDACLRFGPQSYRQLTGWLSDKDREGSVLDRSTEESIRRALRGIPAYVRRRVDNTVVSGRRLDLEQNLALQIIGDSGIADAVPEVLEYFVPVGDRALASSTRVAAQDALAALLRRDARSFTLLQAPYKQLDSTLKAHVLGSVGDYPSEQSFRFLVRELNRGSDLKLILLAQIGRMAEMLGSVPVTSATTQILQELLTNDQAVRREACLALGRMQDYEVMGELIDLLADPHPAVASSAHWALERISGTRMQPNAERWSIWLGRQTDWWQREADDILLGLRSGTPAEVSASLRQLSSHRLYRHELAQEVILVLRYQQDSLVAQACSVLEALASRRAVEALQAVVDEHNPVTSPHARRALKRILG